HGQPHGRADLRGVQGHGQHGGAPGARLGRAAHLPGDPHPALEHAARGAAAGRGHAGAGLPAAAHAGGARQPQPGHRADPQPHGQDPEQPRLPGHPDQQGYSVASPNPLGPPAPPQVSPRASVPPVTASVPVVPAGVAPAGGLSSMTVGRGRYVIDRLLGRGGMSAVYAARDTHVSGRLVAVKEMVDQFADPQERLEAERDFAREADMLATLRHPAIPAIYDRFSENSRHLLVLEYIAGENL